MGSNALKVRVKIEITRPRSKPEIKVRRVGQLACDEALFEVLRALRKDLADTDGVPPYIVFSDVSLRQMAREYPTSSETFRGITGVGEKKLSQYGQPFCDAIAKYLRQNPRQMFGDSSFRTMGDSRLAR